MNSPGKTKKTAIASEDLNSKIIQLLEMAASSEELSFYAQNTQAKLFEISVLADVLDLYVSQSPNRSVGVINASSGVLRLAGSPASADRSQFSYFELRQGTHVEHEVWLSVEVETLSYHMQISTGAHSTSLPLASKHEIDIGVFEPNISQTPSFKELHAGFSCKHLKPTKESVREALGFRRELGLLDAGFHSLAPWLRPEVPSDPPSPFFLASSSPTVITFSSPIDTLGVYIHYSPFLMS